MPKTAKDVLSAFWDEMVLPINPGTIAARMGISVMADPNLGASGHYEPTSEKVNGPLITYNPTEHTVRQRFTIAHELGHHALEHGPRDRDTPENFTMFFSDPKEVAANRFAAQLLMPSDYVHAAVQVRGITDLGKLASLFNVSKVAMRYRLKDLGYDVR